MGRPRAGSCGRDLWLTGAPAAQLEFIYRSETRDRPKLLVKCMYGIAFILLGNLSGNAIAFGIYVMHAAGDKEPKKGPVIGLAVAALSLTTLLHVLSRRAGIACNNIFAVLKVALLLVIVGLGFEKAGGSALGGQPEADAQFDIDTSFKPGATDVASVSDSLLYVVYTFSGYEQPFYVLTEVARPRRVFPRYTLLAMAVAVTLFLLVNAAYFCAVPIDDEELKRHRNMAAVFSSRIFGNDTAQRVMDGMVAFSIFGNLLAMTYTAPRVKQEIAKEGILPWSLVFATSHKTPTALLSRRRGGGGGDDDDETPEQAPMAAHGLHLFTSVLLVALTAMFSPDIAYSVLVTLYSYPIIMVNGFFTSFGLLYLKFKASRRWKDPNFNPRGGTVYAAVYFVSCTFMLLAAFAPPSDDDGGIKWYLLPAIGLSVPLWGVVWYLGLRLIMVKRGRYLVVRRDPTTKPDEEVPGQYVMTAEQITHDWHVLRARRAAPPAVGDMEFRPLGSPAPRQRRG